MSEEYVWVGPAHNRHHWEKSVQISYFNCIKWDYEQGHKNIHDVYTEWQENWITNEQYLTLVPGRQEGEASA